MYTVIMFRYDDEHSGGRKEGRWEMLVCRYRSVSVSLSLSLSLSLHCHFLSLLYLPSIFPLYPSPPLQQLCVNFNKPPVISTNPLNALVD